MTIFADRRYAWAAFVLVAAKLWLVAAQPVVAIGGAGHDDRLYLHLAAHVLNGQWLGSYDQLTLAKGPMYPLWIAGVNLLGIPLPLAQHLLYLAGCWLVIRALRPLLQHDAVAVGLFALLWWNPMSFELPVLGRVLRQNLYTPAALFLFAGAIALETRRHASWQRRCAWGALSGIAFAVLWLTREEGIWVIPSLLLLIVAAAWRSWHEGEACRPLYLPLSTAIISGGLIVGMICTFNARAYGWFGTVEFRASEFIQAYGALQRVTSSTRIPYVPVTRDAREKIYDISPAFAELRPYLEGEMGLNWAGAATYLTGQPREAREIAGGWFMWALRDAVMAARRPQNAGETLAFYARIADEVNQACDEGRIAAGPRHDSLVPRFGADQLRKLVATLPHYADYFVTFRGFNAHPQPSSGSAEVLRLFRDLTRWKLSPSPEAPELDCPQQLRNDAWRITVLQRIGKGLRWLGATTAIAGLLGWAWTGVLAIRLQTLPYGWMVATALLGACTAVVLINAMVHVLSFPNLSPGALAQAYPLLLLFGGLAVSEAVQATRVLRRKRAALPSA